MAIPMSRLNESARSDCERYDMYVENLRLVALSEDSDSLKLGVVHER